MFNLRKFIKAIVGILFLQITILEFAQAHDRQDGIMMDRSSVKHKSTFVTYETNPEHYDIAGNATRTCGKGYNPMSKQHRRHHRFKNPHSHPYVPWRPGCTE